VFRVLRFVFLTLLYSFIALTILSLFLENSGLLKAGGPPKTMEFEPPTGGKVVKFSDVQGVDEAKHVRPPCFVWLNRGADRGLPVIGTSRSGTIFKGPDYFCYSWWEVTKGRVVSCLFLGLPMDA
jgi:hypothetical protein